MAEPAAGLYVELRALVSKFSSDMDSAVKKVTDVEKGITKVFKNIERVTQAALVIGGVVAVKKFADSLTALAEKGEVAESIADGFKRLGGSSSEIEEARKSVLGMVDSFDLMKIANEGLVRGIPQFNENFSEIAELGARLANTLGKDTKGAIEEVTQALATASEKQLRNVGIIIDADKAYQNYAEQIGVSADQLSKAQKLEARQLAAMEQLTPAIERQAEVTDSVANAHDAFKAALSEATKEMGIAVNNNDELREAWRTLEEQIKKVDWNEIGENIAALGGMVLKFAAEAIPAVQSFFNEFTVGAKVLNRAILEYQAGADSITAAFDKAYDAVASEEKTKKAVQSLTDIKEEAERLREAIGGASSQKELQRYLPQLSAVVEKWKEFGDTAPALKKDLQDVTTLYRQQSETLPTVTQAVITHSEKSSKAIEAEQKSLDKLQKEVEKYRDKWDDLISQGKEDSLKKQIETAIDELNSADFNGLKEELRKTIQEGFLQEWEKAIEVGAVTFEQANAEAMRKAGQEVDELVRDFDRKQEDSFGKIFDNVGSLASSFTTITGMVEDTFGVKLPDGLKKALSVLTEIVNAIKAISEIAKAINSIIGFINGQGGGSGGGSVIPGVDIVPDEIPVIGGLLAYGGVLDSPTVLNSKGKNYLAGEAGMEAIMPLTRIGGKLGVMASGGSGGTKIYIDARGATPGTEAAIRQVFRDMESGIIARAVDATLETVQRGGSYSREFSA